MHIEAERKLGILIKSVQCARNGIGVIIVASGVSRHLLLVGEGVDQLTRYCYY